MGSGSLSAPAADDRVDALLRHCALRTRPLHLGPCGPDFHEWSDRVDRQSLRQLESWNIGIDSSTMSPSSQPKKCRFALGTPSGRHYKSALTQPHGFHRSGGVQSAPAAWHLLPPSTPFASLFPHPHNSPFVSRPGCRRLQPCRQTLSRPAASCMKLPDL